MYLIQAALPLSALSILIYFSPAHQNTSLLLAAMVVVMSLRAVTYGSTMERFVTNTQPEGENDD